MERDSFMDLAHSLAERGRFTVAPNPLVGAVIVRDDSVVGEGWHVRPGTPHAEAAAIRDAGEKARGATMYVTLEPCNRHHFSPGPPCSEAIVRAGISKVVIGHLDPNPWMDGQSISMLRGAGVEVEVLDDPAFDVQNEQFFWRKRKGRPFVHVKLAATLDGRIAASGGDSKWITGEESRRHTHMLRAEAGAVLVGAGTARADDPMLTPRGLDDEPPRVKRIVIDPSLTLSPESNLARTAKECPVIVFADHKHLGSRGKALTERGVEVVGVPGGYAGLDIPYILNELGSRDISGVLVEGGGDTTRRFLERRLVNRMTLFYAPKVVGAEGVPMIGSLKVSRMAEAFEFSVDGVERYGDDIAVTLTPSRTSSKAETNEITKITKGEERNVHRAG